MPYSEGAKYQKVVGLVEDANLSGELYYFFTEFENVPVGGEVIIRVDVGDRNAFIVGRDVVTTTDRMDIEVFASPTSTGGTLSPISVYNQITPVLPPKTEVMIGPTVTDDGVFFDKTIYLGQPDNNTSRVGGSFTTNEVLRAIPANSSFLLRCENKGTIPMDGIIKYLFFERDISVPLS